LCLGRAYCGAGGWGRKLGPMNPTFSAHYISGTHWDREWYRPFQEFRVLLVRLLDELLDIMESNEDFRFFQLDGQTCIIDDYLEIRPENRGRLGKLMSEGRILAGPWFTMPDLFCVGDEALIRNLALGRRICHSWGVEPMPVGFICDMFGHPSQMAQIFAGFGIRDAVMGRGANEHTTPPYFNWEAPDGSAVFTFKLQDSQGYGAFALPRAVLEKPMFVTRTLTDYLAELGGAQNDDERLAVKEKWFRIELAKYVNHETGRANGSIVCLMDSMDHIPPATDVRRYLRLIEEACPQVKPRHSNLPAFFSEARELVRDLPTRRGELREPGKNKNDYLWLIPNCVSARVRLKQANDAAQNLLEKYVEPMLALANVRGANIPPKHLEVAWRNLLLNHAHDSICGCSIDGVHRDMVYRFDQARTLGETLRAQCLESLTQSAPELARAEEEFTLVIFNPLPEAREEVVEFDVDLPTNYRADFADGFFTQRLKAFRLETADGAEVPYQRLSFVPQTDERSRLPQFCFQSDGPFTRYRVAAHLPLPALGYDTLRVRPSRTPVRTVGTLRTGPTTAENEFLAMAIQSNGALSLSDKKSGQTYSDLLLFEDRSEVGDGWFHADSLNDEQILSSASRAQVSLAHDGPELTAFRITVTLDVPAHYDSHSERPVSQTVPLSISSVVTLRRGARAVEIETTVENIAEDHRLRLLLPTDVPSAKTYFAHHPFDFVERPIAIDPQTRDWQEMEIAEKPFLHAQAVSDGARGLAFLSAGGLHEGGVADDARRTQHITLLRSFRKTVSTAGESDGLEKGMLRFRYALLPFSGELPRAQILREVARLQTPVLTRQTGARPSGFPALTGEISRQGFIEASGDLVVSAIKPPEEGKGTVVVRLWNPSGETQKSTLRFWREVLSARALMLSEEADTAVPQPQVNGNTLSVEAAPHRIVTLEVVLKELG